MFKKSKFVGIGLGLVGLVLFSFLTMYVLSQAEKGKAEKVFASAKGSLSSLYETMEIHMKNAKENGLLTLMDEKGVASAQLSLNDAEKQISNLNGANKENVEEELIPKMKGIEEYNRIVPIANQLQNRIHDAGEKVKDKPLDPGLAKLLTSLKEELADFTKQAAKIENPSIRGFFQNRYKPQITRLENQVTAYQDAKDKIAELKLIAEKLSLPQGEFDQKVLKLSEEVAQLPYKDTNKGLQEEINTISQNYERNQLAAIEEKKRLEEKRKAEEEQRLAEEKRKAEEAAQEEYEEIFPMEFIEISPDGHKIINSRRPYNNESFYKFDEIAKKHGGRYYYTPSSDVAAIFDKERKAIAFINYGFSTSLKYKELFVDLYVYRTGTSKEEAVKKITKVIDTGEPIKTGEGNGEGSMLWAEDGRVYYDLW
jgi:hypothetical protein